MMANIERMLYPAKITDADIPTFIIPIQAWWAKDLFDKELAEQILWGAKEELALRREVVYYRSKQASGGLKAPGRILWYVSKSGSEKNSSSVLGAIRACSRLDAIVIDKLPWHFKTQKLTHFSYYVRSYRVSLRIASYTLCIFNHYIDSSLFVSTGLKSEFSKSNHSFLILVFSITICI